MAAPAPELELKTLGRYNIERTIGKGAMGVVYEGVDPRLGRRVAIKTILKSHLDEDTGKDFAMRFVREAQAVARLNHPNIVQVYDFGEEGDIAYLVMEFIKGKELKNFFDANERFDIKEAVRIMCELCEALDFAHNAGIIHRDIKPANVMLDAQARTKLTDFGVARVQDSDKTSVERTQAGTMVGTPAYMSPEQITGGTIDKRTDVFSAGIILYQFLTGEKPFTGSGAWTIAKKIIQEEPPLPSSINTSVTPLFDAVVNKALAKDPTQRYQSARDLATGLKRALEGRGTDEDDSDKTVVGPMTGGPAARTPAPKMAGASAEGTSGTRGGATGTQSNQEVELEFWRAIKDGNDPDDFELYVQQFPNGIYAALAKRKIAKLRGIPLDDTSLKAKEQEKKEQEEAARREAEAKTKLEAEKARLEAEMAKREEEYKKRQAEAEAKAKADAEKARAEAAAELEKREAEFKKRQAEQEAKLGMDAKQRAEAEEKARKEAVEKARQEAAAELAKREAEYKKREEEARVKAEQARKEAEEKARAIEEKAKLEAAARAKAELEARIKREAEDKKAKAEAEARQKKDLEERAKREAEFKKREAELKAQAAAGGKKSSPVVPVIVGVVVLAIAAGGYFAFAPDDTAAKKQLEAMQKQLDEAKKKAAELEQAKKQEETARVALQKAKEAEEAARKSGDLAKQKELAEARARAETEAKKSADATRLREDEAKKSAAAVEKAKAESTKVAESKAEKDKAAAEKAQAAKLAAEKAAADKAIAEQQAKLAEMKAATEKAEREAAEAKAAAEKAKAEQQKVAVAVPSDTLFAEASQLEQDGKGRDAVKKYMQAARGGNGKAAKRLGEIYDKGLIGIPRDYAESLKWYNAARVLGEEVPMAKGR